MSHLLFPHLIQRPCQLDDLAKVVEFLATCETVDRLDSNLSIAELERLFTHTPPHICSYWHLWEDARGAILGVSHLWVKTQVESPMDTQEGGLVSLQIHPTHRGKGLEAEIFRWAEATIATHGTHPSPSIQYWGSARNDRPYYQQMYESQGYHPVRWFYEMQRSLQTPIADPQLPPGFQIQCSAAFDLTTWVDLFNDTFLDHWHFSPITVESRRFQLEYPTYDPNLDWVIVAPDGTLAGFCKAALWRDRNLRTGQQEGGINLLGTRRGYRRQGLARALLLWGLQQLREAGMKIAVLGVDSQNPNQARTLYESVGFEQQHTYISYLKEAKNL